MNTPGSGSYLLLAVLLAVQWSYSAQEAYREGGELNLKPQFTGNIDYILWKYNSSLVAEWSKGDVSVKYYRDYDGRTTLDPSNGHLQIKSLSGSDSGVYSVEFNDKVHEPRYTVEVFKAVPRPTVVVKPLACDKDRETCTLTCDGDIDRSGPVTYGWKIGDTEWITGDPTRTINNDEKTQSVKTFTCRLQNRINAETSEPVENPFYKPSAITTIVVVVVIVLLLIAGGGGVAFWKRDDIKKKMGYDVANTDPPTAQKA
ncbi:hypothetical protein PAMA_002107 [Pampus argenteus]